MSPDDWTGLSPDQIVAHASGTPPERLPALVYQLALAVADMAKLVDGLGARSREGHPEPLCAPCWKARDDRGAQGVI